MLTCSRRSDSALLLQIGAVALVQGPCVVDLRTVWCVVGVRTVWCGVGVRTVCYWWKDWVVLSV